VTNVVRHAGASHCEIALTGTAEHVRLTVTDDGRGPGSGHVSGHLSGSGLRGLTERLAAAGGTLTSGPGPGGGFRLSAELPVRS
jgi:two-component system sensor histidine kinase DesK